MALRAADDECQPPALQLHAQVNEALGWLPEFDVRTDRVNGQFPFFTDARNGILSRFGLASNSSIEAVYDDFNKMVESYGARLAIAFAPISERAIFPNESHISEFGSGNDAVFTTPSGREVSVSGDFDGTRKNSASPITSLGNIRS